MFKHRNSTITNEWWFVNSPQIYRGIPTVLKCRKLKISEHTRKSLIFDELRANIALAHATMSIDWWFLTSPFFSRKAIFSQYVSQRHLPIALYQLRLPTFEVPSPNPIFLQTYLALVLACLLTFSFFLITRKF